MSMKKIPNDQNNQYWMYMILIKCWDSLEFWIYSGSPIIKTEAAIFDKSPLFNEKAQDVF